MSETVGLFTVSQPTQRRLQWGDGVVLLGIVVVLYLGVALAVHTPPALRGPDISLDPHVLPYYAGLSIVRMAAAYLLSLLFALWYGQAAARSPRVEHVLMPLLDVLQSVPILSFLPVVLLSLSAVLPQQIAAELAAIVLIFTSQAWNLVFAWYQALKTIPHELDEASSIFRFNGWLRFKTLELPFAAISLIWNSMMSWSGGCSDVWRSSWVMEWLRGGVRLIDERLDRLCMTWSPLADVTRRTHRRPWGTYLGGSLGALVLLYGTYRACGMLLLVPMAQWRA